VRTIRTHKYSMRQNAQFITVTKNGTYTFTIGL